MIAKLLASVAAAEILIAAALVGAGVAVLADPGAGVATFGALWYLPNLIDHVRGRR